MQGIEEIDLLVYPFWELPAENPKFRHWMKRIEGFGPGNLLVIMDNYINDIPAKQGFFKELNARLGPRAIIIKQTGTKKQNLNKLKERLSDFAFKKGAIVNFYGIHHNLCVQDRLKQLRKALDDSRVRYVLRDKKSFSLKPLTHSLYRIGGRLNPTVFKGLEQKIGMGPSERHLKDLPAHAAAGNISFTQIARIAKNAKSMSEFEASLARETIRKNHSLNFPKRAIAASKFRSKAKA